MDSFAKELVESFPTPKTFSGFLLVCIDMIESPTPLLYYVNHFVFLGHSVALISDFTQRNKKKSGEEGNVKSTGVFDRTN